MIQTQALCKTHTRGGVRVEAVRDVTMDVARGEFFVIEGISGSGKSTLLQLLGGLDRPTSGTVTLDGSDLSLLTENELAALRLQQVGFVFQSFNLIGTLNARDNVEAALAGQRMKSSECSERALAMLEQVGMQHRWKHIPSRLSGGEQQRVAIARALANNPGLILADEPTGDLDTKTGIGIIEMLKELSERDGTTVVVVTHAPYVAEYASRRAVMADGRLEIL